MIELDFHARKAIGLQYVLDLMTPCTPYGAEQVRRLRFYEPKERVALEREWENVRTALEGLLEYPKEYDRLTHVFMQVRDIRGTLKRCGETVLTEVELFEIKRFLLQLSLIAPLFEKIGQGYHGIAFTQERAALSLLDPDGRQSAGFSISSAYARPLAKVREERRGLEESLRGLPEGARREGLLQERRLLIAREEEEALAVRARLSEALRPYLPALLQNADRIGRLDFTIQKALLAQKRRAAMPRISEDGSLRFADMENPRIADALLEKGRPFTRVSMEAPLGATVITGANMGGKSVALRTLTLNALLCQAGFFAFAERAEVCLFDQAHIVSGDLAGAADGLSSFGAEVAAVRDILCAVRGGAFCFIALDEPARGTNPREGAALARALALRLAKARTVSVIATHYDGVATCGQAHYQAAGLIGLPDEIPEGDRLAFIARHMNYGLVRVDREAKAPHDALRVCRLLGLDADVIEEMQKTLLGTTDG